jgi:hypothetical protein
LSSLEPIVNDFFAAYAKRMNDALADPTALDVAAMRAAFADYFVGADPNGVRGARNGLLFRLMLPRGIARYRKMGTIAMEIEALTVTTLDDVHAMARVGWRAFYRTGQQIDFTNIYLLQIRAQTAKIFAWITPDEEKALREAGLT